MKSGRRNPTAVADTNRYLSQAILGLKVRVRVRVAVRFRVRGWG
jgi:hypothetical protein